jgi:hypothetical protein
LCFNKVNSVFGEIGLAFMGIVFKNGHSLTKLFS